VSTTPVKNLSPVSSTLAINPCHGEITKKSKKLFTGVNDTAEKLFTGVKIQSLGVKCTKLSSQQNMEKMLFQNFSLFSPVSMTPLINMHSRISPRIFNKIRNGPNGILRGRGDTDL
jgi:hypothetical protein